MVELTRLEVFVFCAEYLNFSEAAKQLHLTQPTVSHHIKSLEQELDVALFDRSGARLYLSEAGRQLLPLARKLLRQARTLEDMMGAFQNSIHGQLRIACSTTAGKYILPLLAGRFRQRYPGIEVRILRCTVPGIIPNLLEGEANLGVVSYELCGSGLECQAFFHDHIDLIVPAGHHWAGRLAIQPEDLLAERTIIRESTSGTRRVMLAELARHDITLDDLQVFMELGNAEAIVHTVAAGFGVGFVSRLASENAIRLGLVAAVPVEGLTLTRKIFMVRRELEETQHAQEVFWGFIHHPDNADLLRLA